MKSDPDAGSHEPSILLIEEYDALAIAINSALRKFAPKHARHVAASLTSARNLAERVRPELLVIDIDPTQYGLVKFLGELKDILPSAHVLVIGCGTSANFAAARDAAGAIRFLEKPFELTDFGEAVQTLLTGEHEAETGGCLVDLDLADLVALFCVNGGKSVLSVQGSSGLLGELQFSGGQLVHAIAPGLVGEPALQEMLRWSAPHFSEGQPAAQVARTISSPWDQVLTTALLRTRVSSAPTQRRRVPPRAQERASKAGKKIVVIDDTELLLIFVEEMLSTAHPELQIFTAHTGTEGCRRAELSNPHLILLDYSLPDINGDEVCRRLLENEQTALIPIVMMSGHVPEMAATAQRFANVVATISKPFLSHELIALVEKTLQSGTRAVLEVTPMTEAELPGAESKSEVAHNGKGHAKRVASSDALPVPPPEIGPFTNLASEEAATVSAVMVAEQVGVMGDEVEAEPLSRLSPEAVEALDLEDEDKVTDGLPVGVTLLEERYPAKPLERLAAALPPFGITTAQVQPVSTAMAVNLPKAMTVLVGLSLRTTAVQMNAQFQMDRFRAKPITLTVSLNLPPDSSPLPALLQTGFDLDRVTLNAERQIHEIRLVPTRKALTAVPLNSRLTIGKVQASTSRNAVELTSDASSSMTVQLLSAFQIATVELSATFEVSRLVLQSISPRARATLDGSNQSGSGVIFQTSEVYVDERGYLSEIELRPL